MFSFENFVVHLICFICRPPDHRTTSYKSDGSNRPDSWPRLDCHSICSWVFDHPTSTLPGQIACWTGNEIGPSRRIFSKSSKKGVAAPYLKEISMTVSKCHSTALEDTPVEIYLILLYGKGHQKIASPSSSNAFGN